MVSTSQYLHAGTAKDKWLMRAPCFALDGLNQKGRRCSCADNVENDIIKAIKRPFNGGVGYKHLATGGTRYCNVPLKAGNEVTIEKVTD